MSNDEKIFSWTPVSTNFEELEARRYAKLKNSPKNMFPTPKEVKPLEGYEHIQKILGL